MAQGHDHDGGGRHEGHAHGVSADADSRKLAIALALILGFMVVEVATVVIAHSLALLSDAGAHAYRRCRDRVSRSSRSVWPNVRPRVR
jgi:Co/Zn/Cd efflux system component